MREPALRVEGLAKSFGGVDAVCDISFTVAAGEMVALIGPNGAGKTTCFNLVNGQLKPDSGHVLLGGERIEDAYKLAADTITQNMLGPDAREGVGAFVEKRTPSWRR